MNIRYALTIAAVATQANSHCVEQGQPIFAADPKRVQLCVSEQCEPATMFRECGNAQGESEDYEAKSILWLFTIKRSDDEHTEYDVLHDPIDPNDIPVQIKDGRPVRLRYFGVPFDRATLQNVNCIPVSDAGACDFINGVLAKVNRQ